jgi:TolB-like protein
MDVVRNVAVERELRLRRLRDTSILSREEVAEMAHALGADRVLLGYVFRYDGARNPAVSLSGRLVDPGGLVIDRMAVTVLEGRSFAGLLGIGGPITLERTLSEAALRFAATISGENGYPGGENDHGGLLKASLLAPSPIAYLAPEVGGMAIERIVVLPFRNHSRSMGAGQIAADLAAWCLVESSRVRVVDAGDATYRLLQRGWRTGMPVGRAEILSLGMDPGVDAVLMGAVERWEEGLAGAMPPVVSISARLLEVRTGRILWAAEHERLGDETLVVYDVGNVRLVEALAARSSFEALKPLIEALAEGNSSGSGRGEED